MGTNMATEKRHDPSTYKAKLDRGLAAVMPDSWVGHARIKIHEADLSDKQVHFAKRLTNRLLEKESSDDAELIGEKSIKQAKKKF